MPIDEASAKVRDGGAIDAPEDIGLPIWAGVIPVTIQMGEPIEDPYNQASVTEPAHVRRYQIK